MDARRNTARETMLHVLHDELDDDEELDDDDELDDDELDDERRSNAFSFRIVSWRRAGPRAKDARGNTTRKTMVDGAG